MKIYKYFFYFLSILMLASCQSDAPDTNQSTSYKYTYETVEGDPLNAKIYTLDNGLKIYMSVNKDEPRVVAQVAVRTGSKQDPSDATGLAHYLEHMLFKGNSKFGTKDWESEKVLIQQISDLYEKHRNTQDPEERKEIYHQIDSVSGVAAQYAIANEYDKMTASLGAEGTNAYTWYDMTVYVNNIPSNELEKWAALESERFGELVLRLFHTELEAVYEEYNRSQDSDQRKAFYSLMKNLFPSHPYGTQTTIGTSEHLKNPSMEKIQAYFKARYKPNNMAIILSGDIDPDATVELMEKYFGKWQKSEVEDPNFPEQKPIEKHIVKEVTGVQPEFVTLGYRLPGAGSDEAMKARVLDGILSNGQAGLIDLNLVQKQKVLRAAAYVSDYRDYTVFNLYGAPREGQDLDSLAALLRKQIDEVKDGNFEDWMIDAVIKNMKLKELKGLKSNWNRAGEMTDAFINHLAWSDVVHEYDKMEKLTKEDMMNFAKEWFGDSYVQVNKRLGKNDAVKVEKPAITPVDIDRDTKSEFFTEWDTIKTERIQPVFVDYKEAIDTRKVSDKILFSSIPNNDNDLFSLYYILDMGTDNDRELGLAISYLPYLGTANMSAEDVQKELFKLGLSLDVFSSRERTYVVLEGLDESLEPGIRLLEDLIANVEPSEEAYADMVEGILKERQDQMKNKYVILQRAMRDYARYGKDSPFRNILNTQELQAENPADLVEKIKELPAYEHQIFYFGPRDARDVNTLLEKYHPVPDTFKPYPPAKEYKELPTDQNKVYFTNYDMVQAEMLMNSKGDKLDLALAPEISLFNEYFGSGLSSIVFQEIRESKALAYSAYSAYTLPRDTAESHYVIAYIGAQVDKLPEATDAMLSLMNNIPQADIQFESARDAAMKKIETNRTTGASIFWAYQTAKKRGIDYDLDEVIYDSLKTMKFDNLRNFFDTHIKGKNYTFTVIGNEQMIDKSVLEKMGPVQVLTLEDLFGYPQDKAPENLVKK